MPCESTASAMSVASRCRQPTDGGAGIGTSDTGAVPSSVSREREALGWPPASGRGLTLPMAGTYNHLRHLRAVLRRLLAARPRADWDWIVERLAVD
jgi:hypothetical protein